MYDSSTTVSVSRAGSRDCSALFSRTRERSTRPRCTAWMRVAAAALCASPGRRSATASESAVTTAAAESDPEAAEESAADTGPGGVVSGPAAAAAANAPSSLPGPAPSLPGTSLPSLSLEVLGSRCCGSCGAAGPEAAAAIRTPGRPPLAFAGFPPGARGGGAGTSGGVGAQPEGPGESSRANGTMSPRAPVPPPMLRACFAMSIVARVSARSHCVRRVAMKLVARLLTAIHLVQATQSRKRCSCSRFFLIQMLQ